MGVGLWEETLDHTILQVNTFPSPVQVKRSFPELERSMKHWSYLKFQLFLWLVMVLSRISTFTSYANYKINRQLLVSLIKQPIRFNKVLGSTFFCDAPHLLKTTRNCFSNSFAHLQSCGSCRVSFVLGVGAISIFWMLNLTISFLFCCWYMQGFICVCVCVR